MNWGLLAALLGLAVYRLRFTPSPPATHQVAPRPAVAEVLADQSDSVAASQLLTPLENGELKQQVTAALAAARPSVECVKAEGSRVGSEAAKPAASSAVFATDDRQNRFGG